MSGIDLLLRTAIGYERMHQLALFALFSKSSFPAHLVEFTSPKSILWEPEGQLFDLGLNDTIRTIYIELKMWSALSDDQQKRQSAFLKKSGSQGFYVLLGTSWFEHSGNTVAFNSGGAATKIGYEELISALNQLMIAEGQQADVYELALAYRNAIQEQFDKMRNAFTRADGSKLYFYSLYWEIQKRLDGLASEIYTVNNQGGPVYILHSSSSWKPFSVGKLSGELYYELVNGRLCIKFHSKASTTEKYAIRDRVRHAIRSVLGSTYNIVDSGRLGTHMTACQLDYDFRDISQFDMSASIYRNVANEFDNIIKAI